MRTLLRALLAVALLVGYYVLAFGIVGGLAVLDIAAALSSRAYVATPILAVVTVPVIMTVLRGLTIGRRARRYVEWPPGVVVDEIEQPELWARVRHVAAAVGTRPPDVIRLVSVVNAAVAERSRMLGLVSGRRTLVVGVPLLVGLSEREFESVLAHELGHYAHGDTRLSGITYRGRVAVLRTLARIPSSEGLDGYVAKIFGAYAKLYFRVSEAVCRRQELAADAAAVRVAGREATAAALRKLHPLDAAWDFYQERYVRIGVSIGCLPREVVGGFGLLLADSRRQDRLREIAERAQPTEQSPYDSHPPMSRRLALVEAAPPGPVSAEPDEPAVLLIADADTVLEAVFTKAMNDRGRSLKRLEWDDFVHTSVHASTAADARKLLAASGRVTGSAPDLPSLFAALAAGRSAEIGERLRGPEPKDLSGEEARRSAMRIRTRAALASLTWVALVDAGHARWEVSWSSQASLARAEGFDGDLEEIFDAAVTQTPDVEPLRRFLASAGVGDDYQP
jgi:Zn-dependent protease with chaperone function